MHSSGGGLPPRGPQESEGRMSREALTEWYRRYPAPSLDPASMRPTASYPQSMSHTSTGSLHPRYPPMVRYNLPPLQPLSTAPQRPKSPHSSHGQTLRASPSYSKYMSSASVSPPARIAPPQGIPHAHGSPGSSHLHGAPTASKPPQSHLVQDMYQRTKHRLPPEASESIRKPEPSPSDLPYPLDLSGSKQTLKRGWSPQEATEEAPLDLSVKKRRTEAKDDDVILVDMHKFSTSTVPPSQGSYSVPLSRSMPVMSSYMPSSYQNKLMYSSMNYSPMGHRGASGISASSRTSSPAKSDPTRPATPVGSGYRSSSHTYMPSPHRSHSLNSYQRMILATSRPKPSQQPSQTLPSPAFSPKNYPYRHSPQDKQYMFDKSSPVTGLELKHTGQPSNTNVYQQAAMQKYPAMSVSHSTVSDRSRQRLTTGIDSRLPSNAFSKAYNRPGVVSMIGEGLKSLPSSQSVHQRPHEKQHEMKRTEAYKPPAGLSTSPAPTKSPAALAAEYREYPIRKSATAPALYHQLGHLTSIHPAYGHTSFHNTPKHPLAMPPKSPVPPQKEATATVTDRTPGATPEDETSRKTSPRASPLQSPAHLGKKKYLLEHQMREKEPSSPIISPRVQPMKGPEKPSNPCGPAAPICDTPFSAPLVAQAKDKRPSIPFSEMNSLFGTFYNKDAKDSFDKIVFPQTFSALNFEKRQGAGEKTDTPIPHPADDKSSVKTSDKANERKLLDQVQNKDEKSEKSEPEPKSFDTAAYRTVTEPSAYQTPPHTHVQDNFNFTERRNKTIPVANVQPMRKLSTDQESQSRTPPNKSPNSGFSSSSSSGHQLEFMKFLSQNEPMTTPGGRGKYRHRQKTDASTVGIARNPLYQTPEPLVAGQPDVFMKDSNVTDVRKDLSLHFATPKGRHKLLGQKVTGEDPSLLENKIEATINEVLAKGAKENLDEEDKGNVYEDMERNIVKEENKAPAAKKGRKPWKKLGIVSKDKVKRPESAKKPGRKSKSEPNDTPVKVKKGRPRKVPVGVKESGPVAKGRPPGKKTGPGFKKRTHRSREVTMDDLHEEERDSAQDIKGLHKVKKMKTHMRLREAHSPEPDDYEDTAGHSRMRRRRKERGLTGNSRIRRGRRIALRSSRKCYTYNKNAAYEEELRREEERRLLKRVRRESRYRGTGFLSEESTNDIDGPQPEEEVAVEQVNETGPPGEVPEQEVPEEEQELLPDTTVPKPTAPLKKKLGRKRHGLKLRDLDVIGRKRKYTILRKKGIRRPRTEVAEGSIFENTGDVVNAENNLPSIQAGDGTEVGLLGQGDSRQGTPALADIPVPADAKRLFVCKETGESMLHKAARLGYEEVAEYCLSVRGYDPNIRDNAGYTPLHECSVSGNLAIATKLLRYSADVNAKALDGTRPIHDAVDNDRLEMARMLLSHGADPRIANYSGRTPVKLARSPNMKAFIQGYFADINIHSDEEYPWEFRPSYDNQGGPTGCDILAEPPSDDDLTEADDEVEFDFLDKEPLTMYHLEIDQHKGPRNYHLLTEVTGILAVTPDDFILLNGDMSFVEIPVSEWRRLENKADGVFGAEVIKGGRPLVKGENQVQVKDSEKMCVLVEVDMSLKQLLDISTETLTGCEPVQLKSVESESPRSKLRNEARDSLRNNNSENKSGSKSNADALESLLKGPFLHSDTQVFDCEQVKKPCRVTLFDIKHTAGPWKINGHIEKKIMGPARKRGVKTTSVGNKSVTVELPSSGATSNMNYITECLKQCSLVEESKAGRPDQSECQPTGHAHSEPTPQPSLISGKTPDAGAEKDNQCSSSSSSSSKSLQQIQKNHLNGFVFKGKVQQLVTKNVRRRKRFPLFSDTQFTKSNSAFSTALFDMLTSEKSASGKETSADGKTSKKLTRTRRKVDLKGSRGSERKDREDSGDTPLPVLEKHDTEDEQSSDEVKVNPSASSEREMPQLTPCASF